METAADLIAVDYVHHDSLLPHQKSSVEGRDAYIAGFKSAMQAFPDMTTEVLEIICSGNTTVARWQNTGTHLGEYNGIPATGNRVTYMGMTMYHWRDGQIFEGWSLFEYTHRRRQMGVEI
jgi:steroid delta-isomerase-like uncharacterized protein